jgi:outer membrane protein OmpA-like peptidoglycan-associated protein
MLVADVKTLPQGRPSADLRNFVACPIVRDTKTVPCWLAEYEGETYFLGVQQGSDAAFYPPQLGHSVLVEGKIAGRERVCGGIPLEPMSASVIAELNPACRTVLPQEDGIDAPPALRPAGPDIAPRPLTSAVPEPPITPPYEPKTYALLFDFDSDFLRVQRTALVQQAGRYAKTIDARTVEVRGERSATLLSNGQTLSERQDLAEIRARKVGAFLVGLGIPEDRVKVTWSDAVAKPDGVSAPAHRRVTIRVQP